MGLTLFFHPFSSYCQKALIGLYEAGAPFKPRFVELGDPEDRAALEAVWPFAKFPVLSDDERGMTVPESSLIVSYVDHHYGGPTRLVPEDFDVAIRVHQFDRIIDSQIMDQVTKVVVDRFRAEGAHDLEGVEQAKANIARACAYLEAELRDDGWLVPAGFTLADCTAAPGLFYAGTIVPLSSYPKLHTYYERLRARPSVARVFEEARPYKDLYPLPWPEHYD